MAKSDPRIHNALLSVNPTTQRPAWHGAPSVVGLLRGVTAETAVWRPHPSMNSLREIALHVAFWANSVANRLTGESVRVPFKMRKTGWALRSESIDAAQWKDEVAFVKAAHERLVRAVAGFDPRRLEKPPAPKMRRIAIEFIHGVAEHSLYHAGQIKILKTLAKRAAG